MKKDKNQKEMSDLENDDEIFDDELSENNEDGDSCALEALQQERDKLKDDFLRALADVENIKKRCAQEIEKNTKYAVSDFAKNLLPVADNLQRAIDAAKIAESSDVAAKLLQGIELTQQELNKAFAKFGIKKMEILGTVFDPNYHQVVQETEDASKDPGTIVAELQTGYMIGDRILREAMVIVTKK